MDYLSVWPSIVCLALLFVLASTRLLNHADSPPSSDADRLSMFDGLRGFLALGVFFCHAVQLPGFSAAGVLPALPVGSFYELLGQVAVQMFFMITGYLFWSQQIRTHGRPDWLSLYIGRAFRIGPVYLVAVITTLVIVLSHTGMHAAVAPAELTREAGRWLALGVRSVGSEVMNGYAKTPDIMLGVTWTLQFEWLFYFSLPVLAIGARADRIHLPLSAAGLVGCLVYSVLHGDPEGAGRLMCAILFLFGMLTASLVDRKAIPRLANSASSCVVLALLAVLFGAFTNAYHALPVVVVGIIFCLIASGCTIFGLLTSVPARRLGNVSYSVYLLHGIVYYFLFSVRAWREFASASPLNYWVAILLCAITVVLVATIVHVMVERPGIRLGKRLGFATRDLRQRT